MSRWDSEYGPPSLSKDAMAVWADAVQECERRKTCYPGWMMLRPNWTVARLCAVCGELEDAGVISRSFPSTLEALERKWPLGGWYRPPAHEWAEIRSRIFARDDYTCQYCGERGKKLECDHVVAVSKGGSHEDDNLMTACFRCNRSKRNKSVAQWKGAA